MYLCKINKDYGNFLKKGNKKIFPDSIVLNLLQEKVITIIKPVPICFGGQMPKTKEDCLKQLDRIQHKINVLEQDKKKAEKLLKLFEE